jgi:uncharacterized protein
VVYSAAMTSLRRSRAAPALLLTAGLLAGSSSGCEATPPPPSASKPAPQASAVAGAASSTSDPAGARPAAKEVDNAVVIGERQVFHSTILGADRTLLVHTPASYKQGKDVYPVLYLLDGEDHFHHTTGITTFLSGAGRAPGMIVVGVTNIGGDREHDLTPTEGDNKQGRGGGGAKFLALLKDEVRPRIEGAYRTAPYRILVGHSLGGLFAVHTLMSTPEAFNAYVAISPSLWWDDKLVLHEADKLFTSREGLQGFLYFTVGNERGNMLENARSFTALLKSKAPGGLSWEFKQMDRESHTSIPHRATYDALETLFAGWDPPKEITTVKALQAHYEALSKKFHFEVKLEEAMVNNFAFRLYAKSRDEAMAAFKLNVELHPDSASVYETLGDAFGDNGQPDLAKANFEIAVRKATEASDPALPELKAKLERASKAKAK